MKWIDFDKENFRVTFRGVISFLALCFSGLFMWRISFLPEGVTVSKHGEVVLGALLTIVVTTVLNFYFGGNDNGQTQTRNTLGRATDHIPAPDNDDDDGVPTEREVLSGDGS